MTKLGEKIILNSALIGGALFLFFTLGVGRKHNIKKYFKKLWKEWDDIDKAIGGK